MASKQSLFAILSRQPWWLSVLVAGALFGSAQLFLPGMIAAAIAIPFLGIACFAGWRQMRSTGASNVAATLEIDAVIDPAETRVKLIAGLHMLRSKREELPKRKHGNVPL